MCLFAVTNTKKVGVQIPRRRVGECHRTQEEDYDSQGNKALLVVGFSVFQFFGFPVFWFSSFSGFPVFLVYRFFRFSGFPVFPVFRFFGFSVFRFFHRCSTSSTIQFLIPVLSLHQIRAIFSVAVYLSKAFHEIVESMKYDVVYYNERFMYLKYKFLIVKSTNL